MILLDTHAWIWWIAAPDKLSSTARQILEESDEIGVSVISCWEVSMLVSKQRLAFDRDVGAWVREALAREGLSVLPISPSIGVLAGSLDGDFHGDPADRLIVATALESESTLVTKDHRIRSYPAVRTVW